MSWRPKKDWENPHLEVLTKSPTFSSKIYEAGADAMLTELFPYLVSARGELAEMLVARKRGDLSHRIKLSNLVSALTEIINGKEVNETN